MIAAEEAMILDLAALKLSAGEIARRMKRDPTTVRRFLRRA